MSREPCAQKTEAMAPSQLFSALILLLSIFYLHIGKCVQVILGDEFTFPKTACGTAEGRLVKLIEQGSSREVAALSGGVWVPADYCRDRVSQNSAAVHINRTVFTDAGAYVLTCGSGSGEEVIQLNVVVPYESSVEEGSAVKLKCHYDGTGKHVESVWWTKHGEVVFERNFSSGVKKHGTGYDEGRVSLLPGGHKEGDMSLILKRAQMEDGGDYFCFVHTDEGQVRNNAYVAAVRVTVNERTENETTNATMQPPKQQTSWGTGAITAVVTLVIAAPVFTLFGWRLKSRRSSVSSGPGAARRREKAFEPLNAQTPPPQVNGCPLSNSPNAESSV